MKVLRSEKILNISKKIKSVEYLGGKCIKCGEESIFKLTFHHKYDKKFEYANKKNSRWSVLKDEIDKCDLLCNNCHRELHYEYELKFDDGRRKDKLIYLEYGGSGCIKCGYNKCISALSFHHRDSKEKEFWIGSLSERLNSILELSDKIKKEIDKCDVLCMNCHTLEHSDIEFFNKNKKLIYERVSSYKEVQGKIDREVVRKMYLDGCRQIEISKVLNASKGTISDIVKGLKLK